LHSFGFSISDHGKTPVLNGFPIEFSDKAVIHPEIKKSGGIVSEIFDQQPFTIAVLYLKKTFPCRGRAGLAQGSRNIGREILR
jgi:hypothetical protein